MKAQCAWALSNIAGDSVSLRDVVLAAGALEPLLASLGRNTCVSLQRIGVSMLSNLVRGKPIVSHRIVRDAVPILAALASSNDSETAYEALWGLTYASDGPNNYIQSLLDTGVLPRLVDNLASADFPILCPSLRAVANIMTGTDYQTQAVLDAGAATHLRRLLCVTQDESVTRECLWAISNVAAGTAEQVQHLIDLDFMIVLLDLAVPGTPKVLQREALMALANAVESGTHEQLVYFLKEGFVEAFISALRPTADTFSLCQKASDHVIRALDTMMGAGETLSPGQANPCVAAAVGAGVMQLFPLWLDLNSSCQVDRVAVDRLLNRWFLNFLE
eukprot:TRINITY_DN14738_c0_g1_i2.p1 TRINITY_DN14738_c0_g1~~TRINITY_DN14738_c0_g1_i2.p1  ORF type:complete len:332 (+),score=67.54 TRINITY_DN14738_c0_g1_i2:3-998(+)